MGGSDAGGAGASRSRRRPTRRARRWRCGASCPTSGSSLTHKFSIAGHDGYITVGMYEDGTPGEIFVRMAKEGSTISGLMDIVRHRDLAGAAARRAAQAPGRQVRAHALRAVGLDRQPGDPARLVDHGLPLPLARAGSSCATRPPEQLPLPASTRRRRPPVHGGRRRGQGVEQRRQPAGHLGAGDRTRRRATSAARSWCARALATSA